MASASKMWRRISPRLAGAPRIRSCIRAAISLVMMMGIAGCQTQESSFKGEQFSDETRALEKQLMAESAAVGTAQAMSMPAAWDPSGVSSLATIPAGLAAREAFRRSADARMNAQLAKDQAAFYRKYGLNPDGSPSGKKGPLSVD